MRNRRSTTKAGIVGLHLESRLASRRTLKIASMGRDGRLEITERGIHMSVPNVPHAWSSRSASVILTFVVVAGAFAFVLS